MLESVCRMEKGKRRRYILLGMGPEGEGGAGGLQREAREEKVFLF